MHFSAVNKKFGFLSEYILLNITMVYYYIVYYYTVKLADRNLAEGKALDVGKHYTPLNHVKDVVNYRACACRATADHEH